MKLNSLEPPVCNPQPTYDRFSYEKEGNKMFFLQSLQLTSSSEMDPAFPSVTRDERPWSQAMG